RESFENEGIAARMNAYFVNVKVDREERPDLDAIYMTAIQAMTGQGGWPMTVFLTPEGKPFYGGTYFPPQDRYGMPGFPKVLESVAETWRTRKAEIADMTESLLAQMRAFSESERSEGALVEATLDRARQDLAHRYDRTWGGFGGAPKFPPAMSLEFLLRLSHRLGDEEALEMAEHTLERMARGGLHDHLGGGFHRYSVDAQWLVPHFEKMLYDNALLSHVYMLAYQVTGNAFYEVVAEETLDWVMREMTSPEGAFYATLDADTEGHEGRFYVWTPDQIEAVLGKEDAELFMAAFDVTEEGNFEGTNVLHLPHDMPAVAAEGGYALDALIGAIERGRPALLAAREKRTRPGRDEKIIASWNGMMLKSFATAARVLDRADYMQVAERNADFLLATLYRGGTLHRTHKDGQTKVNGFLEDYANVIDGLLATYEASFQPRYLMAALELKTIMVTEFWDAQKACFYDAGVSHERLVARPRDLFDNATPAGNSVAADVLQRLALLTGDESLGRLATAALASAGDMLMRYPSGMGRLLSALDFHLANVREVVLVGDPKSEAMQAMKRELFEPYRPYVVVAGGAEEVIRHLADQVPLLANRTARDGQPAAYVCEHFACQAPVSDAAALGRLLGG
ncbi:MAG: thioredoxin domain-containing protein, partial [Candidatus Sericytochromatia bacterium]